MATATTDEKTGRLPEGEGGTGAVGPGEESEAQRTAARLGIPYVDLNDFPIDHDLFRTIPVEDRRDFSTKEYK